MAELGARIGRKAAAATGPAEVFWPDRGVSALDADGQAFFDPAADAACRDALAGELRRGRPEPAPGRRAHQRPGVRPGAMADRLHQMIQDGS